MEKPTVSRGSIDANGSWNTNCTAHRPSNHHDDRPREGPIWRRKPLGRADAAAPHGSRRQARGNRGDRGAAGLGLVGVHQRDDHHHRRRRGQSGADVLKRDRTIEGVCSMDLKDKVAVITGGSGAIGATCARRLAEGGAKIVVGYNTKPDQAAAVVASLPGSGHSTIRIPMLETHLIREAAATVERDYGRCDVLVNSAGFTRMIPHHDLEALTDELIDAIFAANVRGPFATIRAFAALMKRSGDAVIVNISSVAAIVGTGSNIAYGGSKAA